MHNWHHFTFMLSADMLNAVKLSVAMRNVAIISVVILIVVAPNLYFSQKFNFT
jgi:hypothetical protein